MSKVLVVCPDHVKRQMSGPAIRYFELSRTLHAAGHQVILAAPGLNDLPAQPFQMIDHETDRLRRLSREQDVIVIQGWVLELFPFLVQSPARLVVDLYCPFHLELLVDRAQNPRREEMVPPLVSLEVQLEQVRRGDFFICASEKQRDYWMGMLTALNRINPETYADSGDVRRLIDVVPFGLPSEPPRKTGPGMRGRMPGVGPDDYVVLWGSVIYNWFDPLTLIKAVGLAAPRVPDLRLVVMATRHPNPGAIAETAMQSEARQLSEKLGLTDKHVFFNEGWVPYQERANWLLEADVGSSIHLLHIESHFSFRVRFLDYLWSGLPILCTSGDVLAEAVERHGLGRTVAPGDVEGLAEALVAMADRSERERYRSRVAEYAQGMTWERAAEALVRYCDAPWPAADLRATARKPPPVPLRGPAPHPLLARARKYRSLVPRGRRILREEGVGAFARKAWRYVRAG